MLGNKFSQVGRAYFFLTLYQKFNIGFHSVGLNHGFQGFYMHVKLAFIISTAAGIYLTVLDDRIKRPTMPEFKWFGRLYIVMSINQYGWFGSINDFFAINHRMAICFHNLGLVSAGIQQALPYQFRTFAHIFFTFTLRTNRRYT